MLLRAFKQVGASSDPALIQAAKNCVSNMGQTLSFMKTMADILFLLVHDRYQLLPIFTQLTKSGELVEILSLLASNFTRLAELEKSLGNGQS